MRAQKRSFTLTFFIAALLTAAMLYCGGCTGGNSSTTTVNDAAGGQVPRMDSHAGGTGEKPVALPDASPREGGVPLLVHFWSNSYDPDGEIRLWAWNFGDSSGGDPGWIWFTDTKGEAWHTYTSPGTKVAQLLVWDYSSNFDQAFVKIEMRQGNNANPVAAPTADPLSGNAPLTVNFSAAGSYDPDGTIVNYEWDFGDGDGYEGTTGTDGAASHVYTATGTYAVYLRVTDDDGAQSMDTLEIEVTQGEGI